MHTEAVARAQRKYLVERVHRADGRRTKRDHHRAHIAFAQFGLQRFQTHASAMVGGDGRIVELQHGGDTLVSVVRLLGADDAPGWSELPGDPQSLQVGQCAA